MIDLRSRRLFGTLLFCVLLGGAAVAVYWPVVHFDFINFDDPQYVTDNFHVRTGLSWQNIAWAFRSGYASNWHPLTWVSHMVDAQLFGLEPGPDHLTNLIFHALDTILLFLLLQVMTGRNWRSLCVAGLFALHPLHVESVAWVAERKDVLSAFFFFLTLLAYARFARAKCESPTGAKPGDDPKVPHAPKSGLRCWNFYLLALLLFALGLMSKPMLVTTPFVLLLLDFWPLRRLPAERWTSAAVRPLVLEKLPFLALSLVSCVITIQVQQRGGAVSSVEGLPLETRFVNAILAYATYLAKTFWPSKLCIFYPHLGLQSDQSFGILFWKVAGAAVLLLGLTIAAVRYRNKAPYFMTGWFWFLGTLIPVLGVVQVGGQAYADRYTYLPLIGVFMACVWAAADSLSTRKMVSFGLGVLVLSACGMAARRQVSFWRDNFTLFSHALEAAPSAPAHYQVGVGYGKQGKTELAKEHFREALKLDGHYADAAYSLGYLLMEEGENEAAAEQYRAALQMKPNHFLSHNNLGIILWRTGKADEAAEQYEEALRINPDFTEAHENLATILISKGKLDEAGAHYLESLRLNPKTPGIMTRLAGVRVRQGQLQEAEDLMREAVRIAPTNSDLHLHLGEVLWVSGKRTEAIREYEEALQIKPESPEAHFKIGGAFLQTSEPKKAESHFVEAVRLRPGFIEAVLGLGKSLAVQGRISEAVAQFTEVVRLSPTNLEGQLDLANALVGSGKTNEALSHFATAASLDPGLAQRNLEAGKLLATQGQLDAATAQLTTSAYLNPTNAEPRKELGLLLARQNKLREAEEQFVEVARLRPDAEAFHNLGLAELMQGKTKQAVLHYRKAIELKPEWTDALNDLAWILATNPDATLRDGKEALRLAERACEISGGKEARYLGTLDAAYAEVGRFEEAIATANKVRKMAASLNDESLEKAAESRIEAYNRKLPFRTN